MQNLQMKNSVNSNKSINHLGNSAQAWGNEYSGENFVSYKDILHEYTGQKSSSNQKKSKEQTTPSNITTSTSTTSTSAIDMLQNLSLTSNAKNIASQALFATSTAEANSQVSSNASSNENFLLNIKESTSIATKLSTGNKDILSSGDKLSLSDISTAVSMVYEGNHVTDENIKRYDVNHDGIVDQKDIDTLKEKYKDNYIKAREQKKNAKTQGEEVKQSPSNNEELSSITSRLDANSVVLGTSVLSDENTIKTEPATVENNSLMGDINADGKVDRTDLEMAQRYIMDMDDTVDYTRFDFNGDKDKADPSDYVRLSEIVMKQEPESIRGAAIDPSEYSTTKVSLEGNLSSNAKIDTNSKYNMGGSNGNTKIGEDDRGKFNINLTVYDSQGKSHEIPLQFKKVSSGNWYASLQSNHITEDDGTELELNFKSTVKDGEIEGKYFEFDGKGQIKQDKYPNGVIQIRYNGSDDYQKIDLDFSNLTQYAENNNVSGKSNGDARDIVPKADVIKTQLEDPANRLKYNDYYEQAKTQLLENGEITESTLIDSVDMNGDGKVDWEDLQQLRTLLNPYEVEKEVIGSDETETITPVPEEEPVQPIAIDPLIADIDGDGSVDLDDLFGIRYYILGDIKNEGDRYNGIILDSNMIKKMDINGDGSIDEIDFSLAVNIKQGKEVYGTPGSSRDNPLYIVGDYTSQNIDGEYVNDMCVTDMSFLYSGRMFYIGQGDQLKHSEYSYINKMIVSDRPHKIIVPYNMIVDDEVDNSTLLFTSVYNNSEVAIVRYEDGHMGISVPSGQNISTFADDLLIDTGKHTYIDAHGKNTTVTINYEDNALPKEDTNFLGTIVNLSGEGSKIIREKGNSEDSFMVNAPNCRIEDSSNEKYLLYINHYIKNLHLEDVNGIPTIKSEDNSTWIELVGKVSSEITVGDTKHNKQQIKDIPGYKEIFEIDDSVSPDSITIEQNPNNPYEWLKSYTRTVGYPGESFINSTGNSIWVSGGNEVKVTEIRGEISWVFPNLIADGGEVKLEKGSTLIELDGKNYLEIEEGTATFIRNGDKLSVRNAENVDIKTFKDSDNVSIEALRGNNKIELNGKNPRVVCGNGKDEITINGYNAHIIAGDGDDTIVINGKDAYVQGGYGSDHFLIKDYGAMLSDFDANQDTLTIDTRFGKLTAKQEGQSIVIQTEGGEDVAYLLGNKSFDKIQDIINKHNFKVEKNELVSTWKSSERDLYSKIGTLVEDEIKAYKDSAEEKGISQLKKLIINDPKDPVPDNILAVFAEKVADDIASKPGFTKDTCKSASAFVSYFANISSRISESQNDFQMEISGYGLNKANLYTATVDWIDKRGKKHQSTISLPSNAENLSQAMQAYIDTASELAKDVIDESSKKVISSLTGLNGKVVDTAYDIGKGIIEILVTGKTDGKDFTKALVDVGSEVIKSAIEKMIERSAMKVSGNDIFSLFDKSKQAKKSKENLNEAIRWIHDLNEMGSSIWTVLETDSDYKQFKEAVKCLEKAVNAMP